MEAIEKLRAEAEAASYDKFGEVMRESVLKALEEFCRQSGGFARAVLEGGSFEECMKEVSKNCGSCLSDLEAYTRAVRYYGGQEVRFQMEVVMPGTETPGETESRAEIFDITDFL